MIEKIIANGNSSAAIAALDVAVKLGVTYGGWCDEKSALHTKYKLEAIRQPSSVDATQEAIAAAGGSLFFTDGDGATLSLERIKKASARLQKSMLVIDLAKTNGFFASQRIATWIGENKISRIYVDGQARDDQSSATIHRIAKILEAAFFLSMNDVQNHLHVGSVHESVSLPRQTEILCETVEEALDNLEQALSLKDKSTIANMMAGELMSLHASLGNYINRHFALYTDNSRLLADCLRRSDQRNLAPDGAASVIIHALWERLRSTYRIRVIK